MSDTDDLLREAAGALRSFSLRALAVKPALDVPYRDAPGTSPWSAFIEPEARRAHDLSRRIRKYLADSGAALPPPAADCHAPRYGQEPFTPARAYLEALENCTDADLRDALVIIGPAKRRRLSEFLEGPRSAMMDG